MEAFVIALCQGLPVAQGARALGVLSRPHLARA
jgi:hypothetical protein